MKKILGAIALSISIAALGGPALAQTAYPSKPIRIVVPYAPGGAGDITARMIAEPLTTKLGQPVVVENRAGANGTIGTDIVAKAAPDGYTLGVVVASHVLLRALMPQLTFDPITDFVPITVTARTEMALVVTPSLPVNSVKELIEYARANPQKLSYKSAGSGSNSHLFGAWFANAADVKMIHVPYKGTGSSMPDLLTGRVQVAFETLVGAREYMDSGQLKILAAGGPERSPHYPNVPTIAEAGLSGFAANSWAMVMAPKGTPDAIVQLLNKEITAILKTQEVKEKLEKMGAVIVANSPAEALDLEKREETLYTDLIRKLNIELN